MKQLIWLFILFLISCNSSTSDSSDRTHIDSTVVDSPADIKTGDYPAQAQGINVSKISRCEFVVDSMDLKNYINYYHREPNIAETYVNFYFDFDLINETPYRINSFYPKAHIIAEYQDGDTLRLPSFGTMRSNWHLNRFWQTDTLLAMKFGFLGEDRDALSLELPETKFRRTPIKCEFVLEYKAVSVDQEYEDEIRYDILDQWKTFQTQIGFR